MSAQLSDRLRSTSRSVQNRTTRDSLIASSQTSDSVHTLITNLDAFSPNDLKAIADRKHSKSDASNTRVYQPLTTDVQVSRSDQLKPVDIISSTLGFQDMNHQFWWDRTGKQLAELLHRAGYTKSAQYTELLFFAIHIVPELGAAPDRSGHLRWRTPHTPDGTPLEFSWEWGLEGKGTIRTGFEPIGPLAGTDIDPYNRQETDVWIKHLEVQVDRAKLARNDLFEVAPMGGTFVMRDIARSGPMVKAYMYPGLKAKELKISKSDVVFRAIKALPAEQYASLTFEPLRDYLEEAACKWNMEIHIFSFDLISPKNSRVKIYTRAPNTSLEYLMDALTIGGRNDLSMYSEQVIQDVQDFWNTFTDGAPEILPQDGSARGPGFYFTTQAGKIPTPKVYISPGPFCKNDMEVLARLRRYFSTRRDAERMLPQMDNYEIALKAIYFLKDLATHSGCQLPILRL
ncbi:aromatic prenyltransferase [Didymella exigua CBS 183.55]|uniref:Aromatic prenyltransferase n=1 Tax=Didymella exigua CBS 183.55 TaxID=1150837 RepID=A0A6A5RE97_9PLEO|nr:aromatic prenyltransferase [Didymella exigua CBS 183.55]KAF1924027.1 aromatic prenyltransferase [Didymella exigua CBS 183.55]